MRDDITAENFLVSLEAIKVTWKKVVIRWCLRVDQMILFSFTTQTLILKKLLINNTLSCCFFSRFIVH